MDRLRVEWLAPLEVAERRREATRERLAAVARPSTPVDAVVNAALAVLGHLLVAAGRRLETIERRPTVPTPIAADLCGCAP